MRLRNRFQPMYLHSLRSGKYATDARRQPCMATLSLTEEQKAKVRQALEGSWSAKTSVCYNPSIAPLSYGQCAPTTVVVFELFGGEILRTEVAKKGGGSVRHFYNRIGGQRYDFTADQFDIPDYWCDVVYEDIASSVEEARTEMLPGQLEEMRCAFGKARAQQNAS